jgi:predicted nucleic acid-binding protein
MNKIFLDTNVLVSAIDTTRKNHRNALKLIEKIKERKYQAFISTQIIGEILCSSY